MRQPEVSLIPKDVHQFGNRRGRGDFRAAANARRAARRISRREVDAGNLPRVQGLLTPSPDSHIEFEVWLPTAGWNGKYLGTGNGGYAGGINYFDSAQGAPNLLHQDAAYTVQSFDVDRAPPLLDSAVARLMDADNPDLTAFKRRGGKLIIYHGWSDPALSASATIDYYASVSARMGAKETSDFARLYLVPGMQHCNGGPGPNQFGTWPVKGADPRTSVSAALERWMEDGVAPVPITATRPADPPRSRPLCAYPQIAKYRAAGASTTRQISSVGIREAAYQRRDVSSLE